MADINQSNWSETDASNNSAAPDGAPEGMAPSGVNDTIRAVMGAVKRFYSHVNATAASSGTNTIVLTYSVAPAAYETGDLYAFIAGGTNTGAATLNVNSLGAQAVQLNGNALTGGEIVSGGLALAAVNGTTFQLVNSGLSFSSSFAKSGGAITLNPAAASTVGGVKSKAATTHNFVTGLGTDGALTVAQPDFTDISGSLPNPATSTLGGVKSTAGASHNFVTGLGTDGALTLARPASADLSDTTAQQSFTPADVSGAGLSLSSVSVQFMKIGNMITVFGSVTYPSTANTASALLTLPVAVPNQLYAQVPGAAEIGGTGVTDAPCSFAVQNSTTMEFIDLSNNAVYKNAGLSARPVRFCLSYPAS